MNFGWIHTTDIVLNHNIDTRAQRDFHGVVFVSHDANWLVAGHRVENIILIQIRTSTRISFVT